MYLLPFHGSGNVFFHQQFLFWSVQSLQVLVLGGFSHQKLQIILLASIFSNFPEDRSGDTQDKEFSLSNDHMH